MIISHLLRNSVQCIPWRYRNRVKHWPVIAPLQRWLIQRFLANREFLHTVNAGPAKGLRYWVKLPEDKNVWTGTYERDFAAALANSTDAGDVCLDIGGYRGFFAGVLALAGASEVHIFEPFPDNIKRIRALIAANPDLPLRLHEMAVGTELGETDFFVMPEDSMGKLCNSRFQEHQHGKAVIEVKVETLDHLRDTGILPMPRVVKIDVEGAEAMVLRGGERMFRCDRPKVFIEIHSRPLARECSTLLRTLGYSVSVLETQRCPDFQTEPEICHFAAVVD